MQITEHWILAHAPSPAVAEDGRRISAANRFLARCRTEDGRTWWGECVGSAHNPYYVSIDWALFDKEPAYSCSCASRHFPCKHALALMFDILEGKPFDLGEPPAYVLRVRAREQRERERAAQRLEKARKYDAAVKQKKLERQLAALDKAGKLSDQLLNDGLAAIPDLPSQTLERMAAELGNCDLPAARDVFERIAMLDRQCRQDTAAACRAQMLRLLLTLRSLTGRARKFLAEQLSSESYSLEDPLLFEALGGVWNNDELREIGLYRKSARLVQLSFDVAYDETKRAYVERGFWMELDRGDIVQTQSLHFSRSLNYVGTDDSCFVLLEVPVLYESPVPPCLRVWWDDCASVELTDGDRAAILRRAESVSDAAKRAKPHLGNPLLADTVPALLRVGTLGTVDGGYVLEDDHGSRIALRDFAADGAERASARRLAALPEAAGGALFGLFFYDGADGRLCLHPYSLITVEHIIRLQF